MKTLVVLLEKLNLSTQECEQESKVVEEKFQVKVWMGSVSPMNVLSLLVRRGGGDKWVYSNLKPTFGRFCFHMHDYRNFTSSFNRQLPGYFLEFLETT